MGGEAGVVYHAAQLTRSLFSADSVRYTVPKAYTRSTAADVSNGAVQFMMYEQMKSRAFERKRRR
ncbi:hypothetical protein BC827DRAFT_1265497 [Russula dissimulans]|nr:hypothetical protein BC827DRAFT_1272066 [Russula dissimulans]KAH9965528.1 hypothetical protein BC827DRAFT_1265497 [Russula dissimulans]